MTALRIIGGALLGLSLAGTGHTALMLALGVDLSAALGVGMAAGALGAVYSAIAFGRRIYAPKFASILGYTLDMTWSLLNTAAALLVWLPVSAARGGAFVPPNTNSRRSGTFVYRDNPRGGGYAATTIGTVIAGGWDSHEELHVWQARIFGPAYLPGYGFCWLWLLLFRAAIGKLNGIDREAYGRICFEDWAYWGGTHGAGINWGGWLGGLGLSTLFIGLLATVPAGIAAGLLPMWLAGLGGLIAYGLARALAPASH